MMTTLHNRRRNQMGFSLVEMAVVLVIIGLLLGGIIAVRQLIENAKAKNLQKLVDDIRVAASAYYRSQGRLPGDINGDGQIADTSAESGEFFDELVTQKLIIGSLDQVRKNPFGTSDTVSSVSVKYDTTWKDNFIQLDQVPNVVIESLDDSRDDGDYTKGSIRRKSANATTAYFLL